MSIDLSSIASTATSVGFGGITGFLIGFAVKKVMKIILVVVRLIFVAFVSLEYQKIITVNWNKIQTGVTEALGNVTADRVPGSTDHISTTLSNFGIPLTGSLTAGFVIGFTRG